MMGLHYWLGLLAVCVAAQLVLPQPWQWLRWPICAVCGCAYFGVTVYERLHGAIL